MEILASIARKLLKKFIFLVPFLHYSLRAIYVVCIVQTPQGEFGRKLSDRNFQGAAASHSPWQLT